MSPRKGVSFELKSIKTRPPRPQLSPCSAHVCAACRRRRPADDLRGRLDVAAGEVVALVGPNGAGKSTIFKQMKIINKDGYSEKVTGKRSRPLC